jgi:toxin-antitoxin system PIN domain toxin
MIPDINLIVAASRTDHVHHKRAIAWLNEALAACDAGGGVEILPMVAAGFLRLVTNARVFIRPTPITNAIEFIDALLKVPGVEMVENGREWPALRELCKTHSLAGNDIPDAWIAASVKALHGHLVTFDSGFTRWLGRGELSVLPSDGPRLV